MKFFPTNFSFYFMLVCLPLGATLMRSVPVLQRLAQRTLRLDLRLPAKLQTVLGLRGVFFVSVANALFLLVLLFIFLIWIIFVMGKEVPGRSALETTARGFGQLGSFFFGLLMFPTARNSLLPTLFGITWEAGLHYHRVLGFAFLIISIMHMGAVYRWLHSQGARLFSLPMDYLNNPNNNNFKCIDDNPSDYRVRIDFTVPLAQVIFFICLFTIGIPAVIWPLRRKFFELFYFLHYWSFIILAPTLMWHAYDGWKFFLPGIALWFVDRCIRLFRSNKRNKDVAMVSHNCGLSGHVTELRCHVTFRFYPGQFCFINVADISTLEWHPFTIASSIGNQLVFYIRDLGPSTFSGKLHALALKHAEIQLSVDGPYGQPIDFHKYSRVFLVAGGIGITPVRAMLEMIIASKATLPPGFEAHLVWILKDRSMFDVIFQNSDIVDQPACSAFSCRVFVSDTVITEEDQMPMQSYVGGSGSGSSNRVSSASGFDDGSSSGGGGSRSLSVSVIAGKGSKRKNQASIVTFHTGRPHIESLFSAQESTTDEPARTLLFACGPPSLIQAYEDFAYYKQWSFYKEVFIV